MSQPTVPPYQIDPATLPPALLNSEPGSFARYTMTVRIPRIAEETIEQNDFRAETRDCLARLIDEILHEPARPVSEQAADREFWNALSAPHLGRPWLDAPWLWAEAYFYRRLLECTGYFRPGPGLGVDPFRVAKQAEWQADAAPLAVDSLLGDLPAEPAARLAVLLQASLWGNRIDLSYRHVSAQFTSREGRAAHEAGDAANLLVDDTERVAQWLGSGGPEARVTLVADNAGTELAMDLALIDFILEQGLAGQVHLHLKPQPFFVSDAMPADVEAGLVALTAGGPEAAALVSRVRRHLRGGRLQIGTHWFYPTSLCYFQLPDDLRDDLAASRLVILKGDANYRRLLGDAHWPPASSFDAAVAYFPAPMVALRTLKSELMVGLAPGEAEALARADTAWRVNGRRGVIQAKL